MQLIKAINIPNLQRLFELITTSAAVHRLADHQIALEQSISLQ